MSCSTNSMSQIMIKRAVPNKCTIPACCNITIYEKSLNLVPKSLDWKFYLFDCKHFFDNSLGSICAFMKVDI